jgi:hypothetical protein
MNVLLPYYREIVPTTLTVLGVRVRLAEAVDWRPSWWTMLRGYSSGGGYFGRSIRDGFIFVRGRWYVNTYRPVVRLRILSQIDETSLEVVFVAPCSVLALIVFTPLLWIAVKNRQWSIVGGISLFLFIYHCIMWLFFEYERRDVLRHISSLISQTRS